MKNKIDRMKTPAMHLSKRTVALILSVIMLVSSIATGSMLNTFAAYIKDNAAKTDAIADAASEGSAIAESAIPSEDADAPAQADDADEKPDLSGFEENEIVRGMKDDLVSTGAKADLAATGETGHTVYMCPHNLGWDSYTSFKIFVQDDDKGKDYSASMSKYSKTINGHDVYSLTVYEDDGGWRHFQFWAINSNDGSIADTYKADDGSFWLFGSDVDGKIYNGYYDSAHHWDTPVWDCDDVYVTGSFNSWSTNTTKMTAVGKNDYTATVSLTKSDEFKFYVNGYDQKYWGHGSDGYRISESEWGSDLNNSDGGKNIKAPSTDGDYILHFDPSAKKAYAVLVSQPTTSYYLTGWLNGGKSGSSYSKDDNLMFTETDTSGVYTYSFTATGDEGGYQYVTITDSSDETYHPASHGSGTGTAGTSHSSGSYGADNKWQVTAKSGQIVTFTWDTTGAAPVLSWTVAGSGSSGTLTSYKVLYGTDSSVTQLKVMNGVDVYQTGTNEYTVNFSPVLGTTLLKNGEYYIAISKSADYTGILGGGDQNNGNAGNCETKEGNTFFNVAQMQSYNGQKDGYRNWQFFYAHIKLQNNPSGLKFVVTNPYNNSNYKVHYDYYASATAYSEEGGGDAAKSVVVYAKDGAAPINWDKKGEGGADAISGGTKYNYAAIASTKITKINDATATGITTVDCGNASSQYQTGSIEAGKKITVTTTIGSSYKSKYYVAGWCINGATYKTDGTPGVNAAPDTSTSTGVCTLNYTIPTEPEEDYLEITPIYYLRSTTDTITFYLEGYNTVVEKWGNTPYIYPFYGNLNNVANSFGVYPGQPMVYAEGKYSTQIPLKDIPISGASTGTAIKGITINNGYADHVHRNMIYKWTDHDNDAEHKQTYDYDDFYKIYEECLTNAAGQNVGHPNSIIFRIQDETTTYNRSTYGGTKSGARVAESKSSLSTDDLSKIDSGNGWEVLRNRYGQPIDLFGTVVSEPSSPTAVGNNVRVVSTGYNANIAGDYGTAWKVYKKNGTTGYSLIKDSTSGRYAAPPSIFLLRGNASGYNSAVATVGYPEADHSVTGVGSYTDSISKYEGIYKNAYGDNTVKGMPVYITYEKDAQDTRDDSSGTGAYRLDGRWYYTHDSDTVKSTVGIEYWDNAQNKWIKDTVTASTGNGTSGGTNKNNVKFNSDSYASPSNVTTSKDAVINENKILNFTATAGTGYIFEGWYIKYSDTSYDKIVGAAEAASIKATANYELVARFLPIVTGSLTIDHKLAGSSTGEGTVDMTVIVKDGNTTKETYTGSRVYIDGTYISNSYATYTIDVTLKTTPQYDGKVSAFGYDKFNTKNSITATTSPTTLPGAENGLTTSHFTFTVGQLYSGSTLSTTALNYTSTIDATPHYYNFVYNLTTRDNQSKSYTAKGEISLKDYKQYVTGSHSLDPSFVKAKAPFESNFLKKNTLPNVTPTYTTDTHTFTATSTFEQQADIPTYTVRFKLPYNYYTTKSGDHKKYTVNGSTYNADKATFDLAARYDEFVTSDATETTPGSQTKVSKSTEPNHTDNDFITAPDQVGNMYFAYWSIKRLADTAAEQATAPEVARIYYPDFHYRIYGDYYVEAVFADTEANSWHNKYVDTNDNGCSILYIGDSRNQWNDGIGTTSSDQSVAADKIYSDFIFNYRNDGAELKNSDKVKVGMIIERVVDNSGSTKKWAVGSADVSDMSYYAKQNYGTGYDAASVKADILKKLGNADSLSSATKRSGCVYVDWSTSDLNNKNNLEENYSVYSAYGQTVGDHSIEFATNNKIDTYVYRAYAVMKYDSDDDGTPDTWCISDPAYFCMRYTANLKYSE